MREQGSTEWFNDRKGRVTASNVGAILGLSPFATRDDIMRQMVRSHFGAETEFTGNPATEWGKANEENAALDYTIEYGHKLTRAYFVKHANWLGASSDYYVDSNRLLEIKCPYGIKDDPEPKFKALTQQPHYYAQIQIQLFCEKREYCDFWQWTPHGQKLEWVKVDNHWLAENLPVLEAFWEEFRQVASDPELAQKHLSPRVPEITTNRAHHLVAEYFELVEAEELANTRKKEILQEIVQLAGERPAMVAGRRLSKVEKEGAISYAKAVKELLPGADLSKWRGNPSTYWMLK